MLPRTDKLGTVVFKDIPLDSYILEIRETNDYKGLFHKIDLFER
jgi:hypothetical protein